MREIRFTNGKLTFRGYYSTLGGIFKALKGLSQKTLLTMGGCLTLLGGGAFRLPVVLRYINHISYISH